MSLWSISDTPDLSGRSDSVRQLRGGRNLFDLLSEREFKPLSLNEIRPITKQLLVALDSLQNLKVLHTDIKPDNVMLVGQYIQPLCVKLIDFGQAIPASQVCPGMMLQPVGYRAPEVALGVPFTEAIDVWGVGCVLAWLYLADHFFPVTCEYQMIRCMVEVVGQPEDHMLEAGISTCFFFMEEAAERTTWRLMAPEEFSVANNMTAEQHHGFFELPGSLDELVDMYLNEDATEYDDRKTFVDILKQLLHLNRDQRVSPREALQHPFITRSHLNQQSDSRDTQESTGFNSDCSCSPI